MAHPAILAGLIAGYTVGAVVTALAVAQDDGPLGLPLSTSPTAARSSGGCSSAVRERGVARCLRSLDANRTLSSPRR